MRASAVSAIIFANSKDELLNQLTEMRSLASLPFGGRYRIIDFSLSNIVNAGISKVGIITKENYRSLMDHLGNGNFWDLDRKNGGLQFWPPYNFSGSRKYKGYFEALMRAKNFVNGNSCDYVLVCESGVVANMDISALLNYHTEKKADVTLVYRSADRADKYSTTMKLSVNGDGKITEMTPADKRTESGDYTLGVALFNKSAFLGLLPDDDKSQEGVIYREILPSKLDSLNVCGFKHNGVAFVMDSGKSYFESSMKLLSREIQDDLFNEARPIYTKTRDDMPTRYGIHSSVTNSFIADGCIIDGTVKNSILFRGVRVNKGAVVENSILMQGVEVRENARLKYVVSDKNAVINATTPKKGTDRKAFLIKKNEII